METSIDTDSDHVGSCGDHIKNRLASVTSLLFWSHCVNCIDYGRGGRNGWKTV